MGRGLDVVSICHGQFSWRRVTYPDGEDRISALAPVAAEEGILHSPLPKVLAEEHTADSCAGVGGP